MAVEYYGDVYQCIICGNNVGIIEVGGGTLLCRGKEMRKVEDKPETTAHLPDSSSK